MLLQTNSYLVPKDARADHARLVAKFRDAMLRLGCAGFEVYEQVNDNWTGGETSGRFVQLIVFHDVAHQHQVQQAERTDPTAQRLIADFCQLVGYEHQQQQGQFVTGYYAGVAADGSALSPKLAPPTEDDAGEDDDIVDAAIEP